jgi:hypothetical protein
MYDKSEVSDAQKKWFEPFAQRSTKRLLTLGTRLYDEPRTNLAMHDLSLVAGVTFGITFQACDTSLSFLLTTTKSFGVSKYTSLLK